MKPLVSFVVPCYKLAHLLGECLESILSQTYENFEILVMDDCSPDNTAEVALSFKDPRLIYVRNPRNLGHLQNYNKGIALAGGKYVWLISADDRLRRPHALQRYVDVLEANPNIGYVFCPGVALANNQEGRVINSHGPADKVMSGRSFLLELLNANSVVAASGCARKECYEKVSYFPLDMPWGGDWYLWCVYALHYDVAYISEPLVNYRTHDLSMTTYLTNQDPRACTKDDLALHWRIKEDAALMRCPDIVEKCRTMIAYELSRNITGEGYERSGSCLSLEDSERFLAESAADNREEELLRGMLYACLGDRYYCRGDHRSATFYYRKAVRNTPLAPRVWVKCAFSLLGDSGVRAREILRRASQERRTSAALKFKEGN